jgi:hypothetical protein
MREGGSRNAVASSCNAESAESAPPFLWWSVTQHATAAGICTQNLHSGCAKAHALVLQGNVTLKPAQMGLPRQHACVAAKAPASKGWLTTVRRGTPIQSRSYGQDASKHQHTSIVSHFVFLPPLVRSAYAFSTCAKYAADDQTSL